MIHYFFRSDIYQQAPNHYSYIKKMYPDKEVKIYLFYHPPKPNWKAFVVGFDFKIEDIKEPHLIDLHYREISEKYFVSMEG